jgi:hypothetical protein
VLSVCSVVKLFTQQSRIKVLQRLLQKGEIRTIKLLVRRNPMRHLYGIALSLLVASCCGRCKDNTTTRYHDDGRAKPVVAIASMIDTTSFDAAWSLSEELTSMIQQRVAERGTIFVQTRDDFAIAENPFGSDLNWMKREFSDQEFAVFLELVEHEIVPSMKPNKDIPLQELSTNLNLGVRVRVIDLRGPSPKIVLQEIVRDSYFIPKTLLPTDYTVAVWGTDEYRKSPMGIAHAQLVQEVSSRISDYILLAKSR